MWLERQRHILGLFIGVTICVSLWRITVFQIETIPPPSFSYGEKRGEEQLLPQDEATVTTKLKPTTTTTTTNFLSSSSVGSVGAERSSELVLPKSDLFKLIDLSDFNFTINKPICDKSSSLFIVLVHSAPRNYLKRNRIRKTWGDGSIGHKLYFLLGLTDSSYQERQIALENQMFADIIQGKFLDDYKNMTYKHVMALKWFTYFCSNTSYLVKTDDDVFVNIKKLETFLSMMNQSGRSTSTSTFEPSVPTTLSRPSSSSSNSRNFLFCHKLSNVAVKRTYRSKWRVSPKDYKHKYYPEYCPGYIIVYSGDVVHKLYVEAQNMTYFWIDDVHLTGNIRKQLNIPITSFEQYLLKEPALLELQSDSNKTKELCNYLFAWSNVKPIQVDFLWKTINTHC
ncbi:hypothetical protein ACFFRR_010881 [Megaselia abdita]